MRQSEIDINEEYEKLFGSAQKVDLFDPEEDYYNCLRQEIIAAKLERLFPRKLPFEGVKLVPYSFILIEKNIKRAEAEGRHVFFITDDNNGVRAIGYYEPETNYFYVLKDSQVCERLLAVWTDEDIIAARKRFINEACVSDIGCYRVIKDAKCKSPSAAATYALGRRVNGWLVWKDADGLTLKQYYNR